MTTEHVSPGHSAPLAPLPSGTSLCLVAMEEMGLQWRFPTGRWGEQGPCGGSRWNSLEAESPGESPRRMQL